ncbi:MAG: hypothetical protein IE916_08930, partial [Epsilonproteobacteria bacterium]|nr:hypothetical protein [Campylobacterota bacterium]
MFISTYATYLNTQIVPKNERIKESSSTERFNLPRRGVADAAVQKSSAYTELPVNYISDFKALSNKFLVAKSLYQKEEGATASKQKEPLEEYRSRDTQIKAQSSYEDNQLFFTQWMPQLRHTLDQTPKIEMGVPKELQLSQERQLRQAMISTYVANDRYYQRTVS